jgi:hypothetical protein
LAADVLGCLSRSIAGFQLVKLEFDIGDVVGPVIVNMIDKGVSKLLNDVISGLELMQEKVLLKLLANYVDSAIKTLVNSEIDKYLHLPDHSCHPYSPPAVRHDFNFMARYCILYNTFPFRAPPLSLT